MFFCRLRIVAFRRHNSYSASMGAFSRANRFLLMSGEVASEKLEDAEKVVREAYARFLEAGVAGEQLDLLKKDLVEKVEDTLEDTGSSAFVTLMALLDDQPVDTVLALKDRVAAVSEDSIKQRLNTAFPAAEQLLVIAMSADKDALPGACVITRPEQAVDC